MAMRLDNRDDATQLSSLVEYLTILESVIGDRRTEMFWMLSTGLVILASYSLLT